MSNSKPTSILKIFGNILYVLFILACLFISAMTIFSKSKTESNGITVFGINTYVVLSGSMSPTFDAGSYIVSKQTPIEEIKVQDIITFTSKSNSKTMVTHRVIEKKIENGIINLVTQGDANDTADIPTVTSENLIGKTIFYANNLGNLVIQFQDPFFIVGVFIVIMLVMVLPYVVKSKKNM